MAILRRWCFDQHPKRGWQGYLIAIFVSFVAVFGRLAFLPMLGTSNVYITLYPAVIVAALVGGFYCGVLATAISACFASYFWIEPIGEPFMINSSVDLVGMVIFLVNGVLISLLAEAIHRANKKILQRAVELAELSAQLEEEITVRQQTQEALMQLNGELESKVAERTGTLEDMNASLEEEMLERQQAQAALTNLNAELAEKVLQRTNELQDINTALEEEVMERQAAQDSLQELNNQLEAKVGERTRALEDINATLEEEIMERHSAEAALRQHRDELAVSEERYRSLFGNMLNGFAYCQMIFNQDQPADFIYLGVNDAFEGLTGLKDVVGKRVTEVIPGIKESNPELFEIYGRVSLSGEPESFEEYFPPLEAWLLISVYSTSPGTFVAIFDNITRRKLAEDEMRRLAFFDSLTGLPNRAQLNKRLAEEMAVVSQGGREGAILFIDLDDLKAVNDTFGHTYGDMLIKSSGKRIVEVAGEDAFVARIGGDEFIVILPGAHDRKKLINLAKKILNTASHDLESLGVRVHMSASAGIAFYPQDGDTVEEILKNADNAMYAAKRAGKKCCRIYEASMQKEAYEKVLLTNSLYDAVENDEFIVYYQPVVNIANNSTIGFEALLRWNSPVHGSVPPNRFIPLAEQSGLIHRIGQGVVEEACRFVRRMVDQGHDEIRVAVNVSPAQLCADDFVDSIRQAITNAAIQPCNLELEITENALIISFADSIRTLEELREMGVHLSLDDFGTGYSSLTYLQQLPVHTLKIDKAFIDMILSDKAGQAIIKTIVDMAHIMNMTVVAEGVESQLQLDYLAACQCDHFQGYIVSRPVPEAEAICFLS